LASGSQIGEDRNNNYYKSEDGHPDGGGSGPASKPVLGGLFLAAGYIFAKVALKLTDTPFNPLPIVVASLISWGIVGVAVAQGVSLILNGDWFLSSIATMSR